MLDERGGLGVFRGEGGEQLRWGVCELLGLGDGGCEGVIVGRLVVVELPEDRLESVGLCLLL